MRKDSSPVALSPWINLAVLRPVGIYVGLVCCLLWIGGCSNQARQHRRAENLMLEAVKLLEAKDFKGAEERLVKAVKVAPNMVEARLALAEFYNMVRQHKRALRQLRIAETYDPNNPELLEALTVTVLSIGHFGEGARYAKKLISVSPKDVLGYNYLAAAYIYQSKPEDAIQVLKKALNIQPRSPLTYKNLGDAYVLKKDILQAIQHYKKAVELRPDFAEAHDHLGTAYVLAGKLREAEKHFLLAIKADPYLVDPYCDLAFLHADHTGRLNEALHYATKAVQVNPMSASAYNALGWVQYRQGRYKTAVENFKKAEKFAPGDPNIKAHMGIALCKAGDPTNGVPLLKEVMKHKKQLQHEAEVKVILEGCSGALKEKRRRQR